MTYHEFFERRRTLASHISSKQNKVDPTGVLDRGATRFEVPQNDFGVLQNDFGVLQNDFGVPQNDFGVPQNDFGVLQNDF
ncbi:hypothetical protein [Nostoc sp. LPT]|uniref:hypothetical protein n=1 Tax=Nostoc sp. LPT TaxID=2815387 RepID=UPI001DEC6DE8|nr:hypothetical protein [Nostoc sp. LPT]MBN4004858.1 hypothetical protein [Nostoc sp. LPT]